MRTVPKTNEEVLVTGLRHRYRWTQGIAFGIGLLVAGGCASNGAVVNFDLQAVQSPAATAA